MNVRQNLLSASHLEVDFKVDFGVTRMRSRNVNVLIYSSKLTWESTMIELH